MTNQALQTTSTRSPAKRGERLLTKAEFQRLAAMPAEYEWLVNKKNPRTRRAYQHDASSFIHFVGIEQPDEMRLVKRAHVIAWREQLERDGHSPASIRRKLSALSSMFAYLCEKNAVNENPVKGVERPKEGSNEGKTPALSDPEASALLEAPRADTIKGKRDRALLATFLYHGLRREELCKLRLKDIQRREGYDCFSVRGKGGKIRYVEVNPRALAVIREYIDAAGHGDDPDGPLFRPTMNNTKREGQSGGVNKPLNPKTVYYLVVQYMKQVGIKAGTSLLSPHTLRATFVTNALSHGAEIGAVAHRVGHAQLSTTQLYDKRKFQHQDSPVYKVDYSGKG